MSSLRCRPLVFHRGALGPELVLQRVPVVLETEQALQLVLPEPEPVVLETEQARQLVLPEPEQVVLEMEQARARQLVLVVLEQVVLPPILLPRLNVPRRRLNSNWINMTLKRKTPMARL
jgi:uncharacterized membrane protein